MKSIAAVTLFASVVLAQSASLVPSGISSTCSSFLNDFNQDAALTSCTSAIINATSEFAPSLNASATKSTPDASAISSALGTVCGSTSCPDTTIRSKLADFYQNCTAELSSSPNQDVVKIYDVLYALIPLKNAVCSKDDSGDYCVSKIAQNASSSAASTLSNIASYVSTPLDSKSAVSRRATVQSIVATAPNATTFANNNLLFLMLQPDLPSASLCTSCTRNILTSYISFESSTPYGPGLSSSALLSGQTKLYEGVQETCGANFLSGAVAAAAGLSGGVTGQIASGASSLVANTGVAGVIMVAAVLALTASL